MNVFGKLQLLTIIVGCSLAGCGRGPDKWEKGRPRVYPVEGQVQHDGKPVEGALVTFHTTDQAAVGTTDAQGHFVLTTFTDHDGAVAGEHRVTVSKAEIKRIPTKYHTEAEPSMMAVKKELLPKNVSDLQSTVLKATVTSSGKNSITLELPK